MKVKNKKYKAVIFDLGGVYFKDGIGDFYKVLKSKNLCEKNVDKISEKKYSFQLEVAKSGEDNIWRKFFKEVSLDMTPKLFKKLLFKFFISQKGMKNLVNLCKKRVKVGLLTNNTKSLYSYQNKKEHFGKTFDTVVVSYKVGTRKPKSKIYNIIAKRLKVKPEECVFFDDLVRNVKGAKKVGMTAFQFKSAKDSEQKLEKLKVL